MEDYLDRAKLAHEIDAALREVDVMIVPPDGDEPLTSILLTAPAFSHNSDMWAARYRQQLRSVQIQALLEEAVGK